MCLSHIHNGDYKRECLHKVTIKYKVNIFKLQETYLDHTLNSGRGNKHGHHLINSTVHRICSLQHSETDKDNVPVSHKALMNGDIFFLVVKVPNTNTVIEYIPPNVSWPDTTLAVFDNAVFYRV